MVADQARWQVSTWGRHWDRCEGNPAREYMSLFRTAGTLLWFSCFRDKQASFCMSTHRSQRRRVGAGPRGRKLASEAGLMRRLRRCCKRAIVCSSTVMCWRIVIKFRRQARGKAGCVSSVTNICWRWVTWSRNPWRVARRLVRRCVVAAGRVVGVGSGEVGCHAAVSWRSSGWVSAVAAAAQEGPKVLIIAQAFQVIACGSWVRSGWISGGSGQWECVECCCCQSAVSAGVMWSVCCCQPGPKRWPMAAV